MKDPQPPLKLLSEAFTKIEDKRSIQRFLQDLCTPKEIQSLSDRLRVAQLIDDGWNYREISQKTGASTATITRVGRALKYGEGGYEKALGVLQSKLVKKK